jgi:polysaccharide biosynthesis protein PelB
MLKGIRVEKPSSYSVAPGDSSRQSVLSRGALLGVVGMALIGLVLVFPKDDLLSRLRRDTVGTDRELTIAYLRNLIRTEQKDIGLRLLLVEKLIVAREFAEAQDTLTQTAMISMDAQQRIRLAELDTQLAWTRFRSIRERLSQLENLAQQLSVDGRYRSKRTDASSMDAQIAKISAELAQSRKLLEAKLRAAIPHLSSSKAAFALMDQANDVGVPALQQDIFVRLRSMTMPLEDLISVARRAVSLGQFTTASDYYLLAKNASKDSSQRRELIMQSMKVQLAAGQPALAYASAIRELQGKDAIAAGDDSWWQIVDLALAGGQPVLAAQHLQQVVPASWSAQQLAHKLKPAMLAKALDISLAGADLPNAMRLAQAGLIQQPQDAKLRERYAQVLEWGGKPQEAMAQWLLLVQKSANERALSSVFRLAPTLFDDDALLAAWATTGQLRALTMDEIKRVVDIHERMGQPAKGLGFLDTLLAKGRSGDESDIQSLKAVLLERMGRSTQVIAVLEQMRTRQGKMSRENALRLASAHLLRADFRAALLALKSFEPNDSQTFDAEYWDMVADLAYESQDNVLMRDALLRLKQHSVGAGKLSMRDYQVERLLRDAIEQGQSVNAVSWARDLRALILSMGKPAADAQFMTLWLEALETLTARPALLSLADLDAWTSALTAAQRQSINSNPSWLSRRAAIYIALGEKKLAAADYRQSLALVEDSQIRAGYWWLLLDMADAKLLRREMAQASEDMRSQASLFEVQGAGWQFLGEWRQALGFYRKQTRDPAKAKDALWLANYADVLEQAGDAAIAQRVRKQSFMLLAQPLANWSTLKKREAAQALILRMRMSESFASGVEKERLQKMLSLLLREDALDPELRKQAQGLIISWALGGQNGSGPQGVRNEVARRWLWMQQARKLTQEDRQALVYAQAALALAEGDVHSLDRIMEHSAHQLQQIDRLNALRQLSRNNPQRLAQAASYGVELAQKEAEAPRNEQLQEALEQDLLKLASRARIHPVITRNEVLAGQGVNISADIALTPRLRMTMNLDRMQYHSANPAALVLPAQQDLNLRIGARLAVDGGEIAGQFTQRSAWRQVSGLLLQLTRQLDLRSTLQARLELRQPSTDSAALTVSGMQDRAALSLTHQLAKDAVLGLDASLTRYRTQDGAPIGQGKSLALNGTYFLRREYPDLSIRASIGKQSTRAGGTPDPSTAALNPTSAAPTPDFFVPQGATALNFSLGYGLTQSIDNRDAYSRALRPYAEIGWERRFSSNSTSMPWMRMGARGSIAGRDQLALGVEIKPVPDSNGGTKMNRQLQVQYEWIGDR